MQAIAIILLKTCCTTYKQCDIKQAIKLNKTVCQKEFNFDILVNVLILGLTIQKLSNDY